MEQILISKDNCINILKGFVNDLYNKINNKDLSTPYIEQFTKAGLIKTDGNGDMFLCNNGEYIKIDLNSIEDVNSKIQTIYDLFKITINKELSWSKGTDIPYNAGTLSAEFYKNNIYAIGGIYDTNYNNIPTKTLGIYNTIDKTWSYGTEMPIANAGTSSLITNSNIYYKGLKSPSIYKYDILSDSWSAISDITAAELYMHFYNDKIYCIISSGSIYVYDIKTNIMSLVYSKVPKAATSCGSVIYNGKVYIIGGNDRYSYINTVQIYDIESNTWTYGSGLSVVNGYMSSVVYKDKIYCTGGYPVNSKIFVYNISENKWIDEITLPNLKYAHKSVNDNNKIYLVGGCSVDSVAYSHSVDILSLPYISYDIKLPDELDTKLNIIKSDGLGNKLLADNGIYIDPSNNYSVIQDNEISDLVNQICTKEV